MQTAELLEEWKVVKTNNWGRQQKRVIGIGKDTYDGEYKVGVHTLEWLRSTHTFVCVCFAIPCMLASRYDMSVMMHQI